MVAFLLGCEWSVTNPRVEVDHVDASQQALVQAAGQGVDDVVEYLLDVAEVTVDGQDSLSGETALTLASSNGHKSTVELLLGRGAQVSATNMKVTNGFVFIYNMTRTHQLVIACKSMSIVVNRVIRVCPPSV